MICLGDMEKSILYDEKNNKNLTFVTNNSSSMNKYLS